MLIAIGYATLSWIRYQPSLEIPNQLGTTETLTRASIEIDTDTVRHNVDRRFLSFAIDSSQVVGGNWWKGSAKAESGRGTIKTQPFDFGNPLLIQLTNELAPAFLRIGGSDADDLYYQVGFQKESPKPEEYPLALSEVQWNQILEFVDGVGLSLMFTLNAGPSTRDKKGFWKVDNSRALLAYAASQGHEVDVWELGNEMNAYWHLHGVKQQPDPSTYLSDLSVARNLVAQYFPNSRLAGPSSAYWPVIGEPLGFLFGMMDEVVPRAGHLLDIVTWHYYPSQSFRCPTYVRKAQLHTLLVPGHLDELHHWAKHVESLAQQAEGHQEVWLGETGPAQCGGQPGVSYSYASAFWWMDQLGALAARGQKVVVRQTLVGSDYGMLSDDDFTPRPDYWTSLLWKRLMGVRVLNVSEEGNGATTLRAYAHCAASPNDGQVAILLLNLSPNEGKEVEIKGELGSEFLGFGLTGKHPETSNIYLNGRILELTDGNLPEMEPIQQSLENQIVTLPPLSMQFLLSQTSVPACL